jgi:hypothetical protein
VYSSSRTRYRLLPRSERHVAVFDSTLSHVPEPERALAETFRVLRPDGWLAAFDGDYATTTVALSDHDPLQVCVQAMMANSVNDRTVMRRLPLLVRDGGFQLASVRSHGFVETGDGGYMLTVIDRGADMLQASGAIGGELAAALKAEARRRVRDGEFFGHISYMSLIARKQSRYRRLPRAAREQRSAGRQRRRPQIVRSRSQRCPLPTSLFAPRTSAGRREPLPFVDDGAGMAYDEDLANRIRELIAGEPDVSEQNMFGGLVFLIGGNMSVAAGSQGALIVRVDPEDTDEYLAEPHAHPFVMRGRAMEGRVGIDAEGVQTRHQLERWVRRGVAYARSLPVKR